MSSGPNLPSDDHEQAFVCIISLTRVATEPRLLRQVRTFCEAGLGVLVCGFADEGDLITGAEVVPLPGQKSGRTYQKKISLACKLLISRFSNGMAEQFYWDYTGYGTVLEELKGRVAVRNTCFIVCHDYISAPIAAGIAAGLSKPFAIDIHEYAVEQYMHDFIWRFLFRRWVQRLQGIYIQKAQVVSTVCESIAQALQEDYHLKKRPAVIRSMPVYEAMPINEPGKKVTVLYHGILAPVRGLEELIRSVNLWHSRYQLVIRGRGDARYIASLVKLAEDNGVTYRISFEPALPFEMIIAAANRADIGYFVQEDISRQKQFALPNKFFEYIMAGLALCVNDFSEMSTLLWQYDMGKTVAKLDAESIAGVINGFTDEEILHYKRKSLAAANELCWEKEQEKMLIAYSSIWKADNDG